MVQFLYSLQESHIVLNNSTTSALRVSSTIMDVKLRIEPLGRKPFKDLKLANFPAVGKTQFISLEKQLIKIRLIRIRHACVCQRTGRIHEEKKDHRKIYEGYLGGRRFSSRPRRLQRLLDVKRIHSSWWASRAKKYLVKQLEVRQGFYSFIDH